jgi:hypothetical protein
MPANSTLQTSRAWRAPTTRYGRAMPANSTLQHRAHGALLLPSIGLAPHRKLVPARLREMEAAPARK